MSEFTNQKAAESTKPESAPVTTALGGKRERKTVQEALGLVKRHPLGVVVAIGAAAALVEIELAVGILTGVGATALLARKTGPQARQEVLTKGQEVFTRGKAAFERARMGLATRAKALSNEATTAAQASQQPAAAT